MVKLHRTSRGRFNAPMATAAAVLAVAVGSAVVWVMYASAAPSIDTMEAPWWPGLEAAPTR